MVMFCEGCGQAAVSATKAGRPICPDCIDEGYGDDPMTELQRLGQEFDATDQEAAALVEPRIIVRAAKCGHHFDEGCNACASAEKWTNAQLDELRAQLAESQSEREEQARLLGMSGSREARLRAQLAQAEAGKAEMMKALEPFAKCCEDWIAGYEDDEDGAKFRLLIKDYRRAFATLTKHRKAST